MLRVWNENYSTSRFLSLMNGQFIYILCSNMGDGGHYSRCENWVLSAWSSRRTWHNARFMVTYWCSEWHPLRALLTINAWHQHGISTRSFVWGRMWCWMTYETVQHINFAHPLHSLYNTLALATNHKFPKWSYVPIPNRMCTGHVYKGVQRKQ